MDHSDQALVEMVLRNLVSNAIQAMARIGEQVRPWGSPCGLRAGSRRSNNGRERGNAPGSAQGLKLTAKSAFGAIDTGGSCYLINSKLS